MTMQSYTFSRTHSKRDGNTKIVQRQPVFSADGVVPFKMIQMLRTSLDRKPFANEVEAQDGLDVSGADDSSAYQIIWQEYRFIIVPYNKSYERGRGGTEGKSTKINKGKRDVEYPMPIYVLADKYGVSPNVAIEICKKFGFGDNLSEYNSLTKEQADKVSEKLEELSELHRNSQIDMEGTKENIAKQYAGVRMTGRRDV